MGRIISTSYRRTGFGLYCLLLVASLASAADENIETRLARHRGRIVVLNFWATWCAPCIKEMPILVSLHRRYAARGVDVAGASADDETTRARIPEFVQRLKIDFPVWEGATTADMQALGLGVELPATALIDRDGAVVFRIQGVVDKRDLERRVEWLLGDRRAPPPPDPEPHDHDGEEHAHGGVGMEGASMVPS